MLEEFVAVRREGLESFAVESPSGERESDWVLLGTGSVRDGQAWLSFGPELETELSGDGIYPSSPNYILSVSAVVSAVWVQLGPGVEEMVVEGPRIDVDLKFAAPDWT
ncbi:MAG: hypothetical protein ABI566_01345 [Pseudolysinimonas sp.]